MTVPSDKSTTDEDEEEEEEEGEDNDSVTEIEDGSTSDTLSSTSNHEPQQKRLKPNQVKVFIINEEKYKENTENIVKLSTELNLEVIDNIDNASIIIYPSEYDGDYKDRDQFVNNLGNRHSRNIVCYHWILDSYKNGKLKPSSLYLLSQSFNPNDINDDESDQVDPPSITKYACQRPHPLVCVNEGLVENLRILKRDREHRQDRMNALAYSKAIATVKSIPIEITNVDDVKRYPNLGQKMLQRIREYIQFGRINEAEILKNDKVYQTRNSLMKLEGIGAVKGRMYTDVHGIKSIDELLSMGNITPRQKTFSEHFDIKISRDEVERIADYVMKTVDTIIPHCKFTICGGYRRGKDESNDVDIVITHHSKNLKQISDLLTNLKDKLKKSEFLVEVQKHIHGKISKDHDYQNILMGVIASNSKFKTRHSNDTIFRRLDIITVPPQSYFLTLLGWTGSIQYERDIRLYAHKELNLRLNSTSIYNGSSHSEIDFFSVFNERSLLKLLELPYFDPKDRNCD